MTDEEAVVRRHVRAFNDHDLEALLNGLTEDGVWITGRTTARGRAELADLFGPAMAELAPTLTVRTLLAGDGHVACELTEALTIGGSRQTVPIAGFYDVADGRISGARIYREGSAELA